MIGTCGQKVNRSYTRPASEAAPAFMQESWSACGGVSPIVAAVAWAVKPLSVEAAVRAVRC
ncbi:hypothetical protein ACWD00_41085 [Streptomyces viridiviolaceus]